MPVICRLKNVQSSWNFVLGSHFSNAHVADKFPGILCHLFLRGSTQEALVITRVTGKTARRVKAVCFFH